MVVVVELQILKEILSRLDKLEAAYENGIQNNKTLEIKNTRQLMQDIVKYYKEITPPINVQIGIKLHIFRLRDTIAKVKNLQNNKFENRRLMKWIRKLEEYQFICKVNADTFEVLDTGQDWVSYNG